MRRESRFRRFRNPVKGADMGIDTHTREPVVRKPVVLMWDPSYGDDDGGAATEDACRADDRAERPSVVSVRLGSGQDAVSPGTRVLIMSERARVAAVWVTEPSRRRLGKIVGPEAHRLVGVCQRGV